MKPALRVQVVVQNAVDPREIDGGLPSAAAIRGWAGAVLAHERRPGELTVRMVGAAEGAALNERYRRKPGPTNVLSFSGAEAGPPAVPAALGDIVVCAPVVEREARAQGKAVDAHWAHMVVHGVLHLLGYDHGTPRQARVMETLEKRLLTGMGFPDPYAAAPGAASVIG